MRTLQTQQKMALSFGVITILVSAAAVLLTLTFISFIEDNDRITHLTNNTPVISNNSQERIQSSEISSDQENNMNQPVIYHTGMILTNLGNIDQKNGHYWMDFVIFIEAEGVDFIKEPPLLSFVNGRNLLFSDELIESNYYEIRVQGEFFNVFNYHLFPFQELSLKVEVEPKIPFDANKVVFKHIDSEPIDPSLSVHGWTLIGSEIMETTHTYPDGLQFSRFVANFKISHEPVGVALSTILPVTILTAIAMFIFFVPENFTPRIYLTAPILLSVVYWHQSNLDELPVLGYLTFFDRLMLIYYALFVNAILSLSIQMKLHEKDHNVSKVRKINRCQAIFIPIIVVIGMLILLNM